MAHTAGRNITLDYTKLALIMLIISGHSDISDYGLFGWFFSDGFARVTVPLFLIVNGYYFADIAHDKAKVKKYLSRLLIIYVTWTVIYFPFVWYMTGGGKKLILINLFTGYYHLWYIASLIGAALLIYLTHKCNMKVMLITAYVLFLIGYVIQKIYLLDVHIYMYPTIVRTFLFMGFPFMFAGYYIKKNNLEEKAFFKSTGMVVLAAVLMVLLLVESTFVYYFKLNEVNPAKDEIYFVVPFLCPLLFLTVLKYSKYEVGGDGYMSKMVSSIYFVHILAIFIITGSPYKAEIVMFPIYFFLSVLMSAVILELNKRFRIFL
ncbi:surface polysaccharide O-acyltransferase-like enzyme [Dysgonomonas sp. PFB1-18]|uniref:acyltransferase family protein n=1 Tax=unclassified Dysgonomonas TaxID=2630389 RepID=UPI00247385C6|nr:MULTISPECIES: acyltransferase [unclassified Dysgonomonas]MDL2303494.1 acyltransferase [Dysgonomonas sp. OttesenSCG-928-D17]MDH6309910.1 surface polysaccharide O-acyltransferase-like enzyme [Dysgonomonas sp. PF1-14]MDH6339454.1 surface polysaccharide O-acyltransferase-like enzyme [Dysgonomonas sp. PF1-16]MDH6380954.1 surface polysaccharide O-acyltransferase-like enzyme [Dysgonomonas sp. PFB1-18]MDH6397963.1 surface polysaccharide O-acyltransferase-like enzyme [Dysgonomonas sp. PF1-23]